ncbi:MAG: hypothetical protein QGD94_04425 [Planctomycetia bacterium]|nr:hypothetical protein [Planctomycetia bacterium]
MKGRWSVWLLAVSLGLAVTLAVGCRSSEHPSEHPEKGDKEHPEKGDKEHPEGGAKSSLTKEELAQAIEAYVKKQAEGTGGAFEVMDAKADELLKLTLLKVHEERLSKVGKDRYFACADFKADNGKTYDLDVFMTGTDTDDLKFSAYMVHKEEGEARYTWHEKGGVWVRKTPDGKEIKEIVEKGAEHPAEHPTGTPAEHSDEPPAEHPAEHP